MMEDETSCIDFYFFFKKNKFEQQDPNIRNAPMKTGLKNDMISKRSTWIKLQLRIFSLKISALIFH